MIKMIVACDKNNLIGTSKTENQIPWHNKEDFQHFRKTTLNQNILLGRNTYFAIGKPLPKRHTIILSFDMMDNLPENVECVTDLNEVLKRFKNTDETLYVCGGASIYACMLEHCDELLLSRIPGDYEGDTYFPEFKQYGYVLDHTEDKETFTLEVYKRG